MIIISIIPMIMMIIIAIALITLAERKIMGSKQRRIGPNKVSIYGIIQPIYDGIKLVRKETIIPSKANTKIFIGAPIITLTMSLLGWLVIPYNKTTIIPIIMESNMLYMIAISSIGIYGIIFSGWASNSKYSFLGSLRSTAQLISYEVILGIIIITIVILSIGAMNSPININRIVEAQKGEWNGIKNVPGLGIWLISILAETNRTPFDLVEAESELVSGFHTEYSALPFAYFYLAEYSNIILMSTLTIILFFGGFESTIGLVKITIIIYYFIWIRSSFPRLKYMQLIALCWTKLLPMTLGIVIIILSFIITY